MRGTRTDGARCNDAEYGSEYKRNKEKECEEGNERDCEKEEKEEEQGKEEEPTKEKAGKVL